MRRWGTIVPKEAAMNQSLSELVRVIQQGIAWVLHVIERLWDWSWTQIISAFNMRWFDLPTWKLILGLVFMAALAYILYQLIKRCLAAFEKIATAFWTMTATLLGILTFVVIAGAFSLSFQWLVRTVPDRFWEKFL
jgi:hypothetical protein